MSDTQKGILAIIGASAIWGFGPIFFKLLSHVPPQEVLAHRALWSFLFFAGLLALQGRLGEIVQAFSNRRQAAVLMVAAAFISLNWFLFIVAVQIGKTTETSLGYYMYPLVSVIFGTVLFREQLHAMQWIAIALVGLAVAVLTWGLGVAPWMSLVLAVSFAVYGAIKKQIPLGPLVSVTCEILFFMPIALILLFLAHSGEDGAFGSSTSDTILLITAGPATSLPLILFGYGAKRIAMSTVGLLLYINPTLQFFCAVVLFSEPFTGWHAITFPMIWVALAIYSIAAMRLDKPGITASASPQLPKKPANPTETP